MSDFDSLEALLNILPDRVKNNIFTPVRIAKEMINALPDDVWNSSTKFLDIACKSGIFLYEIQKKLMATPSLIKEFPDTKARRQHILKNQLYGIAMDGFTQLISIRTVYGRLTDDNNICCIDNYARKIKTLTTKEFKSTLEKEFRQEMKFDVVIGNPPYQDIQSNGGGGTGKSAGALYNHFIVKGSEIGRYMSFITPTRWYSQGGKDMQELREILLSGNLVKLVDFPDASGVFDNVSIAGGVSYWLWDKGYRGKCKVTNRTDTWDADLQKNREIFVRYKQASSIIEKIAEVDNNPTTFDKVVSSTDRFGLLRSVRGMPVCSDSHNILVRHSDGIGYISEDDITKNNQDIGKYKLITGYMNGSTNKVLGFLEVLKPNEVCTLSYIVIDANESEVYTNNLKTYIETKFVRFLIKATVTNSSVTKNNYCLVPFQDFSHPWTDEMLYKKYNLSDEEIAYIETTIKPME